MMYEFNLYFLPSLVLSATLLRETTKEKRIRRHDRHLCLQERTRDRSKRRASQSRLFFFVRECRRRRRLCLVDGQVLSRLVWVATLSG